MTTQCSWPTIVKESYAIVYAIDKLKIYLQGTRFSVYTDHCPLTSLFTKKIKKYKLIRWQVFLSEFGGEITYIQGKTNNVAYVLSRQLEPLPCV